MLKFILYIISAVKMSVDKFIVCTNGVFNKTTVSHGPLVSDMSLTVGSTVLSILHQLPPPAKRLASSVLKGFTTAT